jgi:hypothetical protein
MKAKKKKVKMNKPHTANIYKCNTVFYVNYRILISMRKQHPI